MTDFGGEARKVYRSRGGLFSGLRLRVKGLSDGRRGRPVRLDDGTLDSEFIRETLFRFEQDASLNWSVCSAEVGRIEVDAARTERRIIQLRGEADSAESAIAAARAGLDVTVRKAGEESIDDGLVAQRRRAELEAALAPRVARAARLRDDIARLEQELAEMRREASEHERLAVLRCNCLENDCRANLSRYVRSALGTLRHPPAQPWRLPEMSRDGQRLYMAARNASLPLIVGDARHVEVPRASASTTAVAGSNAPAAPAAQGR